VSDPLSSPPVVYELDDYAALYRHSRGRLLRFIKRAIITVLGLLIAIELLSLAIGIPVDWLEFLIGVLLAIIALFLATRLPQLTASIGLRSARRAGFLVPQTYTITRDEFQARSERGSTSINWHAVQRVERSNDRLFVFIAKRVAYIVPRRVFANDGAFDAFCAAAEENFDARA
jgi:hypothetical protein